MLRAISFFVILAASSVMLAFGSAGWTQPQPAQLTILGDLSSSAPLQSSAPFAQRAAGVVREHILSLMLGDKVVLRPIGTRSTQNIVPIEWALGPRNRQRKVADEVYGVIAGTPSSKRKGQEETSLIFTLESGIPCGPRSAILIISDGIEASRDFSKVRELLAGKAQLPKPAAPALRGCKVTFLGIGLTADGTYQLNTSELQHLTSAWRSYLLAAGVAAEDITFRTSF